MGQSSKNHSNTLWNQRATAFAAIIFVCGMLVFVISTVKAILAGKSLFGIDFAAFWSASVLTLSNGTTAPFDGELMRALQITVLNSDGILLWHYPATYMTLIRPLGWLPYIPALILFSLISLSLWVFVVRKCWPDQTWAAVLPVLSAPVVWLNLAQGQNGVFTAALLIGFLLGLRDNRIWLTAACAALLLIKPHFGVLMPVVLLMLGRWATFGAACLLSVAFIGVATAVCGVAYWQAFFANTPVLSAALLDGGLLKQQISGFAFVRGLGGGSVLAYSLQACSAAFAISVTLFCWRTPDWNIRIPTFLIASLCISPYAFQYDMVVSALACGFLWQVVERLDIPWGRPLIALFWFAPLLHQYLYHQTGFLILYPLLLAMLCLCLKACRVGDTAG